MPAAIRSGQPSKRGRYSERSGSDWFWRSANETKRRIDDYAATAGARISQLRGCSGNQPSDPVRAAHAIVNAGASPDPLHHLLLGNAPYDLTMGKPDVLREEFCAREAVSRDADSAMGIKFGRSQSARRT